MESAQNQDYVSVADFYNGKTILVTGGLGFIGKITIEKLLFSCRGIKNIFMLVRRKKNVTMKDRVRKMLDSIVFERIKERNPKELDKIVPIEGDLREIDLGINGDIKTILLQHIQIVLHIGASVSFKDDLMQMITNNTEGINRFFDLLKQAKRLEGFVYVSTAFSNAHMRFIGEKVYEPLKPLNEVYAYLAKNKSERAINKLIGGHPNSYTYSKALAEYEVAKNHGDIPIAIVRPSIVLSTMKDPVEGWLDNLNGPTALMVAASEGFHRFQVGNEEYAGDLIPADIVANMIILAGTKCRKTDFNVYNCVSSTRNPVKIKQWVATFLRVAEESGSKAWRPTIVFLKWHWMVAILNFFYLTLRAFVLDCALYVTGTPPRFMKLRALSLKSENMVNFFSRRIFDFEDDNAKLLFDSLSPTDKKIFFCDPAQIDWEVYIRNYSLGTKKYVKNIFK